MISRFVLRHLWMWRLVWTLPVIAVLIMTLRFPPSLQITMLDVGQGDGIVIRHKDFNILIDGGSTSKQAVGEYQILPYLKHEGIGVLDAVFISHEDKDHISGVLELLDDMERGGVQVRALFLPEVGRKVDEMAEKVLAKPVVRLEGDEKVGIECDGGVEGAGGDEGTGRSEGVVGENPWKLSDDNYKMVVERAASCGVPVMTLCAGERFSMGELQFTCLGPFASGSAVQGTNANARSMILHMSYGSFSALFTGDVEEEGLEELKAVLRGDGVTGNIDLLKVPHHGSRYTTDEEFLTLTRPEIALISCGRNNSYGHPHTETLRRLSDAGITTLITARDGAITVRVSRGGRRAAVETFLK